MAKLTFKTDNCKGCGLCVDACPKKLLRLASNKINKKGIGNVGDGKWHTISLEMSQSSVGYDVVIKVDGVKLGDTLSMKTNINFSGENALTQLMIFGGNKATVAQVEALGDDYKCTCEFDNFVIYAK